MKKNKVFIHLMGRDYALLTDQDAKQVQRLARYVDRKMREVSLTTRAGENMVPMLTAMTLAGELFSAQDENTRLKKELASLKSEQ
ncbi:MAG: cell division protein ZapA [Clostridia bacterium]|nr:cell division protein ZapA [Clostridia bacterium]